MRMKLSSVRLVQLGYCCLCGGFILVVIVSALMCTGTLHILDTFVFRHFSHTTRFSVANALVSFHSFPSSNLPTSCRSCLTLSLSVVGYFLSWCQKKTFIHIQCGSCTIHSQMNMRSVASSVRCSEPDARERKGEREREHQSNNGKLRRIKGRETWRLLLDWESRANFFFTQISSVDWEIRSFLFTGCCMNVGVCVRVHYALCTEQCKMLC